MEKNQIPVEQAGAIVYRVSENDVPKVLIVRAKKNPDNWIFPKGHIEPGETPEKAAERELAEEAGVEGKIVRYAGDQQFEYKDKQYHVVYYLHRFIKDTGNPESGRNPRWCTIEEALDLLAFNETAAILQQMIPYIAHQ